MDVEQSLRDFLVRELGADPTVLTADYDLFENGVVDSLGMFDLVRFIEERLGVPVADDDLSPENFGSIEHLVRMVEERRTPA